VEPIIKVNHTSRCHGCAMPAGTRVRLGDENGPPRIAVCPCCDIIPGTDVEALPPGMRAVVAGYKQRQGLA
jgi:hypothetical protein